MTEKLEIPSPAELSKRIEAEEMDRERKKTELATELLRQSGIATFLYTNSRKLMNRNKVTTDITINSEQLSESGLKIVDLIDPIQELLNSYDVVIEEKASGLILTINPQAFFNEDVENK